MKKALLASIFDEKIVTILSELLKKEVDFILEIYQEIQVLVWLQHTE